MVGLDRRAAATYQQPGDHRRRHRSADPEQRKRERGVDPVDHPGEVHAEEPGDEGKRQEDRRDDGEPVDGLVEAQVDQVRQRVRGGVDPVDQAAELGVDALEVVLAVGLQASTSAISSLMRSKIPL